MFPIVLAAYYYLLVTLGMDLTMTRLELAGVQTLCFFNLEAIPADPAPYIAETGLGSS
jgi:hypothetical protein